MALVGRSTVLDFCDIAKAVQPHKNPPSVVSKVQSVRTIAAVSIAAWDGYPPPGSSRGGLLVPTLRQIPVLLIETISVMLDDRNGLLLDPAAFTGTTGGCYGFQAEPHETQ